MNDIEQKRKRIETAAKVVGVGVVGFVLSPFVFVAIKGIIGMAIAAVLGYVAICFVPVIASKIANWRLKALKAEASKNPIETLQNDYGNRQRALQDFRERIRTSAAAINSFESKLDEFKRTRPERAAKYEEEVGKMKQVLASRAAKYQRARASLEDYYKRIEAASDEWDMAQATIAMTKAVGTIDGEEFLQKIMVSSAMDSVQRAISESFSDLETSLMDEGHGAVKGAALPPVDTKVLPQTSSADPLDLGLDSVIKAEVVSVEKVR